MTSPQQVLNQLLKTDTNNSNNLELLKKIIMTVYLGRLQVNGLPPDNAFTLGDYLFDDERIILDFTRLSAEKRDAFNQWLLQAHQQEKEQVFFNSASVNEYRGFTAEVAPGWWNKLNNWFENKYAEYWKISDFDLTLNYQLTGVELCHGKQGTLIGLNQYSTPATGTKYTSSTELQLDPLGNTKRVYLTESIVALLLGLKLNTCKIETICNAPHPQSIDVINSVARSTAMHDYRRIHNFLKIEPWYMRLYHWICSWFISEPPPKNTTSSDMNPSDNNLQPLIETETINIYQRSETQEVLVTEKKPDIDNIVFCGGGPKIFGHIGVWQALNEAKIRPTKFAGTSAGAIISLLCYLGYASDEISEIFKEFKQEHLVYFDINRNGLSDSHSLKTALDYAVAKKIMHIVTQYKIPYPQGTITFATLEALRQQCPDCGIGKELTVTATNIQKEHTRYFSLKTSPAFEVTKAVTASSSVPVLYRPTLIDGDEHSDGSVLSNFPTEAFSDDNTTLLESEHGNNLKLLAVQFENGTERNTVDRIRDRVYRENFFVNLFYRLMTGVSDSVTGLVQDRLKLRKYAAQSIIVDTKESTQVSFTIGEEARITLIQSGYEATKNYLSARYKSYTDKPSENEELMYSTFSSLGELLGYCCYRGNSHWFEMVSKLIVKSSLPNKEALMQQTQVLKKLYFDQSAQSVADHTKEH
ncbi:MAG: Dot/Icm T4SS effector VpdC, partial [Legionellales bacterium]